MNAAATNTATRFSVCVRRHLCLHSSSLKRWRLLATNTFAESTRALPRRSLAWRRAIVLAILGVGAAELEPHDSVSGYPERKNALLILPTSAPDTQKAGHRNIGKPLR